MRSRIAPILLEPMLLAFSGPLAAATPAAAARAALDEAAAARFAALALKCLHQEYPNHISHTLGGDADARAPRELTPAFYGCYDWHSAVHAHWLLVRLIRLIPDAPFAPEARAAVAQSLAPANIEVEVRYLRGAGRASFARPYGLARLPALPAADPGRPRRRAHRTASGRAVARARSRDRPRRPQARAHRRPEPEPRLDARGHRAWAARARCARCGTHRRGRPTP